MADQKLTQLDIIAGVAGEDLIYVVDDPSGTPVSKRATVDQLVAYAASAVATLANKSIDAANNDLTVSSTDLTDTADILLLSAEQLVAGAKTFSDDALLVQNPAETFAYTIQGGAITGNRTLSLPALTDNDTLVAAGFLNQFTNINQFFDDTIFHDDVQMVSSTINPTLSVSGGTASTNGRTEIVRFWADSAGDATDGFGSYITIGMDDSGNPNTDLARIGAERDGADNSGTLFFQTASGGVFGDRLTISPTGAFDFNSGSVINFVVDESATGNNIRITRYKEAVVVDYTTAVTTGDGKFYTHTPPELDGFDLVYVHAEVITAGTTGTTDIQIHNVTQAADMLSTKLTIDSGQTGSDTAVTPAVIDTANDDVATNDLLRIDVDDVSTTAPQGLNVTMGFKKPAS